MDGFEARALLDRHGLRATRGRLRILDVLRAGSAPLSAGEVHESVGTGILDLATIYRTLERFAATDLVRPVQLGDGIRRYEIADGDHHHHLVCTSCGAVENLASCQVAAIEELALREHGFHVASHALEFFGTCRGCALKSP